MSLAAAATDLVQAASLLLATVAALYSVWYHDLHRLANVPVPARREDAERSIQDVRAARRTRATPLLGAALVTFLVFLPDSVDIVSDSGAHVVRHGIGGYDAVEAALVAATAGAGLLAREIARTRRALGDKLRKLESLRPAVAQDPGG